MKISEIWNTPSRAYLDAINKDNNMFVPMMFHQSLSEQERYNNGFEDAFNSLAPIVKKLGKKYYKEFLLEIKKKENKFYTSHTFTTHPHKCNCEYCELNN